MSKKLLPCPFCGGAATVGANEYYDGANTFYIYCASCGVQQMTTKIRTDEAIAAWNRRTLPENSRQHALQTGVCPMCEDCPDGCPVETPNDSRNRPENEPLTLEQLREMDGEPVFAVDGEGHSAWVVVNAKDECCADNEFGSWAFSYYEMMMPTVLTESENKLHPMGWLAYRHKPKEEHHEAN